MSEKPGASLLDGLMPRWEFGERHGTTVDAPPERALAGVRRATPGEMPLVRLLFAARSVPAAFTRDLGLPTGKTLPLFGQMLDFGFTLLAEDPGQELVCGVVGQMWRMGGGDVPAFEDAESFLAFDRPGYARVAMNFCAISVGGRTELTTETRVLTTDPTSHRNFELYWRVIRPGSAMVRRSWLRAARRRAERPLTTGPGKR